MTIEETAEFLRCHDNFIIASHDGPDADGLGAAYSLALALRSVGKKAIPVLSEKIPPQFQFIDLKGLFFVFSPNSVLPIDNAATTFVIVDTHDPGYLGTGIDNLLTASRDLLIIDHHEAKTTGESRYCLQPTASSTCELIFYIAQALGSNLSTDAAEAIFSGIVYDTGSFAYPKTSESTFACALELVRKGVVPYVIHNHMYESSSIGALILQKRVLSSLELHTENRIAIQTMRQEDLAISEASYEDGESLINIPLRAGIVEVSILFKENPEGRLRCSLRSKGMVNVAHIAQTFGGGGHKTAAGFSYNRPLERMKEAVLESIARALPALP